MVPNLDLILLAFLFGSFIACVLLAVIFVILIVLLLAFSLTLFSIVIIDLHDVYSFSSQYIVSLDENFQLGAALILYMLMYYAIHVILAWKPLLERKVSEFKVKAQHVMNRIEAVALVETRRL